MTDESSAAYAACGFGTSRLQARAAHAALLGLDRSAFAKATADKSACLLCAFELKGRRTAAFLQRAERANRQTRHCRTLGAKRRTGTLRLRSGCPEQRRGAASAASQPSAAVLLSIARRRFIVPSGARDVR